MEFINTDSAPQPAGHYSQAVVQGGMTFVAGQVALDPETGEPRTGSIAEQTEQALRNVVTIVRAAGSDLDRVLKTTVYITDIELWAEVNEAYARFFGEPSCPAGIWPATSRLRSRLSRRCETRQGAYS
jgi:2-iminobutanoate/2-iminopropanoate deaminase